MKAFTKLLLLFILAGVVSLGIVHDSGYVLIAYGDMSFETSVWMFFAIIVLAVIIYNLLKRFAITSLRSVGFLVPVTSASKLKRAKRYSSKGLDLLINGEWEQAGRLLGKAADQGEAPLINYLTAARAANEIGDNNTVIEYLRKADDQVPNGKIGIGITQAQIQLANGQWEQALATLEEIRRHKPRHQYVLKLLKQVYVKLHEWEQLTELLPDLRKRHVVDEEEYQSLQQQASICQLNKAIAKCQNNSESVSKRISLLEEAWSNVPRKLKKIPAVLAAYTRGLIKAGATGYAEKELRKALERNYDAELVELYGLAKGEDLKAQLGFIEELRGEYSKHPEIALALGRLYLQANQLDKAEQALRESLQLHKTEATYIELSKVFAKKGRVEESTQYLAEGLALVDQSRQLVTLSP
ncbi:heme biosynthesis HemY N-terminal domain-containing protein [Spartinivicinus poritis]|uniref:Tetratricopeptide repeat protein n=1 Tax=Spartinivicinus poritis TaxID=2994640 RepID=A0ABT5U4Y8_9GAMM|nr:heme biosynthesis HemY N-terminal domain-containing protein [Spartinivicinus sp. A2-2]MDE1461423.1 tetratricopeptide repeat protein [Spartinivicinus sp. A2-2]